MTYNTTQTIGELAKQSLISQAKVKYQDGAIGFTDPGYWIELTRIPNRAALIRWVLQLLTKNWITKEMLEQFISAVCYYKRWNLYD